MLPLNKPIPAATTIMTTKPRMTWTGPLPALSKNEPITTVRPASGPTDRSMPPVRTTHSWPSAMNASAAIRTVSELRLKVDRNLALWAWV